MPKKVQQNMYQIICNDTRKIERHYQLCKKAEIIVDSNATQICMLHAKQIQASLLKELILFRIKPNKSLLPFVMHVGVGCWLFHQEPSKQTFYFYSLIFFAWPERIGICWAEWRPDSQKNILINLFKEPDMNSPFCLYWKYLLKRETYV